MRNTIKKIIRLSMKIRTVGIANVLMLSLLPRNTQQTLKICGHDIVVRARTPDLDVAIESLKYEYTFLDDLLPPDFDGLIVDAGGYIGTAAISFASRFPKAQVLTVEPSSVNLDILRVNIARYPNIEVRQAALGISAKGTITLRNRSTGAWGYTIVESKGSGAQFSEIEEVQLTSLEEIKTDLARDIDFLKLDIEGGEKQIFDENDDELQDIPFVFIELHERIVEGCVAGFKNFSRNRWVMRLSREKFVSIQSNREKVSILG